MSIKQLGLMALALASLSSFSCSPPPTEESTTSLEAACLTAIARKHSVAETTVTLEFGRSDEGGSAYAYTLADGTMGTCRVLDGGTIDYVQTAAESSEMADPRARLEAACLAAIAEKYGVAPATITLIYGRSDEGGSAYAFTLADGSPGTCRVLNDGTVDYIQDVP